MESIPYETETYYTNEYQSTPEQQSIIDEIIELKPCPICTRTFAPKTLLKHVKICEKMTMKKRKTFDSSRQRREGTDLADFLPKNFGLPPSKQEPKTPPKVTQPQTPTPVAKQFKRSDESRVSITKRGTIGTPTSTQSALSPSSNSSQKEKPKPVLNRLVPQSEPCPYCERCFGAKAYDRHVEWCKEKTRISAHKSNTSSVAKERLQARTQYRAPIVKSKRAVTREKYSGLSCDDSTNSLSDGGSGESASKSKANSEERKIMSTSLCSSIMSDSGLSDKYDPFISAKRQLEELCSPTDIAPPILSPTTPTVKKKPISPMSQSYTNSRTALHNVKSNFHRTLSLRTPRRTHLSRPMFPAKPEKPTIQRGISDEGPISTNFLKPEEYDEMPVKSVCVNDFAVNKHSDTHSPKIIKRDSNVGRNRRNLKLNLKNIDDRPCIPLSKTDSLAVFLQYENASKILDSIPNKLTEKDLKDKSNTLSKQTSLKSSLNDLDCALSDKDKLSSLKNSLTNLLDSNSSPIADKPNNLLPITKVHPIKLEPLPKILPIKANAAFTNPPLNLSNIIDPKENDFIDPNLINVCDNLSISVTKLSDSDLTSDSTESAETTKQQPEPIDLVKNNPKLDQITSSNRNSTEKRNLLKRQLRLGKNQFLYDMSPDMDPYSEECDKTISMIDSDSNKLETSTSTLDPVLDEFDIEEFISSFDDAEEYPLFKDYKEFLSTRSLNKRSNNPSQNSIRSLHMNDDDDHQEKNEIFSSHESIIKQSFNSNPNILQASPSPCSPEEFGDINGNHSEDHLVSNNSADDEDDLPEEFSNNNRKQKSESTRTHIVQNYIADDQNNLEEELMYQDDLDKISSVESLTIKKSYCSKQSADSAYGSLSRHSPVERTISHTSVAPSRQQSFTNSDQYSNTPKILFKNETKRRSRGLSASSSSSEASMPVQNYQKDKSPIDDDYNHDKKDVRMSKFCHECGSKFLISQAKFCMECGVKRLALE